VTYAGDGRFLSRYLAWWWRLLWLDCWKF